MVGYVIYTIPVAFLLIHNTMGFVDKKTLTVSKVMGDKALSTFWIAVLRPLLGTFAGSLYPGLLPVLYRLWYSCLGGRRL